MTILFLHNRYRWRGGEDEMFDDYVKTSIQIGHHTVLYTQGGWSEPLRKIVELVLFPFTALFSLRTYRDIYRIVQKEHPDFAVVFNPFPFLSISALLALRNNNIPIVLYIPNYRLFPAFRSNDLFSFRIGNIKKHLRDLGIFRVRDALYAFIAYCYRIVDLRHIITEILVPSKYMKDRIVSLKGFPHQRIAIIEHCSAPEAFRFTRNRRKRNTNRLSLVYVGRLSPEKGVNVLIHAVNGLNQVTLTIIGDGPQRRNLMQLAHDLHVKHVRFVGQLWGNQKWKLMQKSDICVVPSVWPEPFGLSVVEAMAMGMCVVASRSGAIPDLISDHVNGILFEAGNAKDLASKLKWLTFHDDVVGIMGSNARITAKKRFVKTIFREELNRLFRRMLRSRGFTI